MTNALSLYDKVNDPVAAVTELGKHFHNSGIMNVNTPGDGVVLALTCMTEGITPLDFVRKYHLINGRPSMRADAMLAEFRRCGGKVEWLNLGDDCKEARAKFTFDGQSLEIAYTIEEGKRAAGDKFDKKDSNWQKDPGAMLRARLTTKAIRIIAPELVAGVYEPGELQDSASPAEPKMRTVEQVQIRQEELAAMGDELSESIKDVIDVPFEPSKQTQDPQPEETSTPSNCTPQQLQELVALGDQLGKSLQEVRDGICRAANVEQPADMTHQQASKLIERFQSLVNG